MQHDHVLTKFNFDLLTPRLRGSVGKIFATISLHFVIPIHDHVLKTSNFDLLTRSPREVGEGSSEGKTFATMYLHFVITVNLICNMTMF